MVAADRHSTFSFDAAAGIKFEYNVLIVDAENYCHEINDIMMPLESSWYQDAKNHHIFCSLMP